MSLVWNLSIKIGWNFMHYCDAFQMNFIELIYFGYKISWIILFKIQMNILNAIK